MLLLGNKIPFLYYETEKVISRKRSVSGSLAAKAQHIQVLILLSNDY